MGKEIIYDVDVINSRFELPLAIKDNLEHAEYPFAFLVDGKMVAYGDAEEYGTAVHIRNVWSIETRKGFGTVFLDYLFTEKKMREIRGESTPEAAPFWSRMGATFDEPSFQEFLENDEFQDLIPFCLFR